MFDISLVAAAWMHRAFRHQTISAALGPRIRLFSPSSPAPLFTRGSSEAHRCPLVSAALGARGRHVAGAPHPPHLRHERPLPPPLHPGRPLWHAGT
jgi:hypothetical protein